MARWRGGRPVSARDRRAALELSMTRPAPSCARASAARASRTAPCCATRAATRLRLADSARARAPPGSSDAGTTLRRRASVLSMPTNCSSRSRSAIARWSRPGSALIADGPADRHAPARRGVRADAGPARRPPACRHVTPRRSTRSPGASGWTRTPRGPKSGASRSSLRELARAASAACPTAAARSRRSATCSTRSGPSPAFRRVARRLRRHDGAGAVRRARRRAAADGSPAPNPARRAAVRDSVATCTRAGDVARRDLLALRGIARASAAGRK